MTSKILINALLLTALQSEESIASTLNLLAKNIKREEEREARQEERNHNETLRAADPHEQGL